MGDQVEAISCQQKAVLMSERVNGIDHPYTHLALYCFANTQVSTTLKLLYRARYIGLMVCGENHPDLALIDSNIGLILHAVGKYDISLRVSKLQSRITWWLGLRVAWAISGLNVWTGFLMGVLFDTIFVLDLLLLMKRRLSQSTSQLGDEHDKIKEFGKFAFKFS